MGKSKYMQHLREEIAVLMERPVSLGRAEEICAYADTICALQKMDGGEHYGEAGEKMCFTEEDARRWTEHMENDDGSTGTGRRNRPQPSQEVSAYITLTRGSGTRR